ncbi:SprT family zinc-dependent metalloprotease [uncultured Methylophaga sp.]|uniref:M48 family metallopeptidase n=1 Tax=uncultured Methylophaga sp. TaxID=285271 RepID=UPI0030D8FDC3|tara:strand:- start:84 stop:782 length:699 start_codon:yes stop_codon:yes gene_type:complete
MPQVTIGNLAVELNRKDIKNLHVSVLPPDGRVRVSAPLELTDIAIRTAVVHRLPWIKKQQRSFAAQRRETSRQMVSGESHFLWGRRYRLEVIEQVGKHEIVLSGAKLKMFITPGTNEKVRLALLNRYYRREVKIALPALIEKWQETLGTKPVISLVRKMRTKWGSCNIDSHRIVINSELAKKPTECLDFIVLHEMVHLLERHHNERFKALMTQHMPNWEEHRAVLNNLPIGH